MLFIFGHLLPSIVVLSSPAFALKLVCLWARCPVWYIPHSRGRQRIPVQVATDHLAIWCAYLVFASPVGPVHNKRWVNRHVFAAGSFNPLEFLAAPFASAQSLIASLVD